MKIIYRIGLLVLFSLVGVILMHLYSSASLERSRVKWESLGTPSSKAMKAVGLGYVQTESGEIFQYIYDSTCQNNCWVKSDTFPPDSKYWLPLNRCGKLPPLESFIDYKAVCDYYGTGKSLSITAIDRDGFVYSWDDKFGGEGDSLIRLVSPFLGAIIGLLFGFIVVAVDLLNSFRKRLKNAVSEKK